MSSSVEAQDKAIDSRDFVEGLISSRIAVSFSGSLDFWREESDVSIVSTVRAQLGLSESSIELRTGGSRFQLGLETSLSRSLSTSRLSNGRGERTLNELLDCSCKIVEVLSASPQHLALADNLADKLTAVTEVLARKVRFHPLSHTAIHVHSYF